MTFAEKILTVVLAGFAAALAFYGVETSRLSGRADNLFGLTGEIRGDVRGTAADIAAMQKDVDRLWAAVEPIQSILSDLKQGQAELRHTLDTIRSDTQAIKNRQASLAPGDMLHNPGSDPAMVKNQPVDRSESETAVSSAPGKDGADSNNRMAGVASMSAESAGSFSIADLQAVIGTDIVSASGEDLGKVNNVVLKDGRPLVVVGAGGFLGIGEKEVAIPWEELAISVAGGQPRVSWAQGTRDKLEKMPTFFDADAIADSAARDEAGGQKKQRNSD